MRALSKGHVRTALAIMRGNRSRSLLTMLGVIVGVAAVIIMVGIGDGIKQRITQQVNQYSKNVITVRPASIGGNGNSLAALSGGTVTGSLTNQDSKQIAKVPEVNASVPLTIIGGRAHGDATFNGLIVGASSNLSAVINQPLAFGVFFTDSDFGNNVAVLGANAADKMFDQNVPLGRSFTVRGQQFIVDGVLSSFAATPFANETNFNNAIFIPNTAAAALANNSAPIYEILAKVGDSQQIPAAHRDITSALLKTHGGQRDFSVLDPNQVAGNTTSALTLLTELIVAGAAISLLVGGIGIMNVMLVSVTERMHEIGIRKAVGATNRQILNQFVVEATTLSFTGCVIGVGLAFLADLILRITTNLTPVIRWQVVGLTALASLVIGVIFGTVPAYKAARKDPISALRNE